MTSDEIHELIDNCSFPDTCNHVELKETHISWVILTDHHAFKIKRPVKFSFADFSTLEKRKYFCHKEIELNRRLAPNMYQGVFPVYENQISKNNGDNQIKDYAVKMERMDTSKEMDRMLMNNEVTTPDISKIANIIARFHNNASIIRNTFDVTRFQELYADILSVNNFVEKTMGHKWKKLIEENVEASNKFLNRNRDYLNQRVISGFVRDCHGDLNAKNIFLYDEPVIFDCIEFNDEHRHIDILNDIAFFCVDLDFYGRSDFSDLFYDKYLDAYGTLGNGNAHQLFYYYKNYRANIRAKVTLLHAKNSEEGNNANNIDDVKKYLTFMNDYTLKTHVHDY